MIRLEKRIETDLSVARVQSSEQSGNGGKGRRVVIHEGLHLAHAVQKGGQHRQERSHFLEILDGHLHFRLELKEAAFAHATHSMRTAMTTLLADMRSTAA